MKKLFNKYLVAGVMLASIATPVGVTVMNNIPFQNINDLTPEETYRSQTNFEHLDRLTQKYTIPARDWEYDENTSHEVSENIEVKYVFDYYKQTTVIDATLFDFSVIEDTLNIGSEKDYKAWEENLTKEFTNVQAFNYKYFLGIYDPLPSYVLPGVILGNIEESKSSFFQMTNFNLKFEDGFIINDKDGKNLVNWDFNYSVTASKKSYV